ncbi:MAG: alpha/beta hydrolase [Thermoanaerobaculia bacterium]
MTSSATHRPRRRGWWILGSLALVVLALPLGCSMFGPQFAPQIDTPQMRDHDLHSEFADTPFGRMHVVVAGLPAPAAARVLFVHGSPGTWDGWEGYLRDGDLRLAARMMAPDRLGFGGSERGHAEISLERQAASLAAVLESEAGPPAVVVGHSLGGPIAVRLAMDRPDLVAGLLLIAPSIDPAQEHHLWYNVFGAMMVVQWFLPVDWTVSNREIWPLQRELTAMLPLWKSIRCPVILVQGSVDDLVPPENADFAEREMAAGQIRVDRYAGENHFILWKRPETVKTPLLELLNRNSH